MITDAIISAFLAAIAALFTLIPSVNLPALDTNSSAVSFATSLDNIFPVRFLLTLVVATIVLHVAFQLFEMAVWVYHQLHGSN